MTAPETLRAAAAKLREDVLAQAEPGGPHWTDLWLPPDLAEPLAAWLDETARMMRFEVGACSSKDNGEALVARKHANALAVALVILGGES